MVIGSMFVYHFVDPDLRVEILPCKCLKKISCKFQKNVCFLEVFWLLKIAFRSSLDLYFNPSIIKFRMGEKIHAKAIVDVSRGAGGRIFL